LNALVMLLSLPATALSKVPGMEPVVRACRTSVGQKILMALTGLLLCGFLVAHLSGNLLLFAGEEQFNAYAEKLHSLGPLLAVAEIGLFALFCLHLGLAVSTIAMNRAARRKNYDVKESKQEGFTVPNGASTWMVVTGILVLVFLVTHIADLKLQVNPLVDYDGVYTGEHGDANAFQVVRRVLGNPINAIVYTVGLIALGIHLSHGVRSACQSLGISHRRWDPVIQIASNLFAWVIAAGFLSLIVWAFASGG
jgi:succinate dehydrogenase cytochrome b subunit